MQIERLETLEPRATAPCAAAIGNFDGVHRGHARLVAETVAAARELDGRSVVLTFDPHPARVLMPESAPSSLLTLAQKAEILGALGVDTLAVLPFTPAVAGLDAESFARDVLGSCLGAAAVVIGDNFRFGRGRTGDSALLSELGVRLGWTVTTVEPVTHLGQRISSTRVRRALAEGDVAATADLLGRRFFVDGVVEAGEGRGRRPGVPDRERGDRERDAARKRCLRLPVRGGRRAAARGGREPGDAADVRGRRPGCGSRCTCSTPIATSTAARCGPRSSRGCAPSSASRTRARSPTRSRRTSRAHAKSWPTRYSPVGDA